MDSIDKINNLNKAIASTNNHRANSVKKTRAETSPINNPIDVDGKVEKEHENAQTYEHLHTKRKLEIEFEDKRIRKYSLRIGNDAQDEKSDALDDSKSSSDEAFKDVPKIIQPVIKTVINSNQKQESNVEAEQTAKQHQNVTQTQEAEVKLAQGLFNNLKEDILDEVDLESEDAKEKKRIQNELSKYDKAFKELEKAASENRNELNAGAKSRIGEFIDNLSDENSRINKFLKLVTNGANKVQKFGRTYNKFATYFGLPKVPEALLGDEK
jgi:hypothetical protein